MLTVSKLTDSGEWGDNAVLSAFSLLCVAAGFFSVMPILTLLYLLGCCILVWYVRLARSFPELLDARVEKFPIKHLHSVLALGKSNFASQYLQILHLQSSCPILSRAELCCRAHYVNRRHFCCYKIATNRTPSALEDVAVKPLHSTIFNVGPSSLRSGLRPYFLLVTQL